MTRLKFLCMFGILCMFSHLSPLSGQAFIRGDANSDGTIDLSDPISLLTYLFSDGSLTCRDAGDANDSGAIDLADAIYLLSYQFTDGPEPPDPFSECGSDATSDDLGCESYSFCQDAFCGGPINGFTLIGANPQGYTEYSHDQTGIVFVCLPGGTFMMGAEAGEQDSNDWEKPQHQVTLTKGFYLGKYEVTKRQWEAVMGTTPWAGQQYVLDDPDSPAVYVSWNDAQEFIEELNKLGQGTFCLPTEAQWEYACRAGTTTRFYWGDDPAYTEIGNYAWYDGNAWDVNERYAHVVGQKLPNDWGLYDMSGNVWEWCQDWWGNYSVSSGTDPTGPVSGPGRVFRGGGWNGYARSCRCADRGRYGPDSAGYGFGFRVVRAPGQ